VVEEILGAIGSGRLGPRDRLPSEQELAGLCGASRPTVRDALLALELFGVVEVRPRSGAYITEQGARTVTRFPTLFDSSPRELLEAREQIEPGVARLCADRMSTDSVREVAALIDECEEELSDSSGDHLDQFLHSAHRFHGALAEHCGNATLETMTCQLVDVSAHPLWRVVNGLHMRSLDNRVGQIAEHRSILEAIARGDGDGAAAAMSMHLVGLSGSIFGRPKPAGVGRSRRRRGI
jgi:GntR family transcriptional repressor for pyruvate dehydrogenase complex